MLTGASYVMWRSKEYVPGCVLSDSYPLCFDPYDFFGRVPPVNFKSYFVSDGQFAFSGGIGSIAMRRVSLASSCSSSRNSVSNG